MKRFFLGQIIFLLLFSIPLTVSGSEDDYYYGESPSRKGYPQDIISLEEAMKKALEVVPGDVIKAELEHGVNEIKVFSDDGWVTKVYIDPADGSIIKPPFYKKRKKRNKNRRK